MSRLAGRLAALEARTGFAWFALTTTAGRTVRVPVDTVLDVYLGGPVPPALADVSGTREVAELAHGAVRAAVKARMAGGAS